MKVLALAADNGGCGFYRLRAPAEEVAKLGVDITISSNLEVSASQNKSTGMTEVHEIHTDADLIIFQRPLDNAFTSSIKQAKKQGIATVVEIDDDFSFVNKNNSAYPGMFAKTYTGAKWVENAASIADHVTVSTPQLEKYARHGRSSILRNCVPDEIFNVPLNNKTDQTWPRIGWTGSVRTHPNDLQATKGSIASILTANSLNFNVIGDGLHVATNLQLDKTTPVYATGWVDINLYYQYIASFLDIGIVPLELSPFNQAKSALKGMEYAALGVPFVASPTREYERMEAYGIGKTAKSPGDWRRHLQRMIDRPSETERIGRESRDRIKAEHTYSVHAPKWLEAWEKAIDYRKTHHE